jgi:hypothetical protein
LRLGHFTQVHEIKPVLTCSIAPSPHLQANTTFRLIPVGSDAEQQQNAEHTTTTQTTTTSPTSTDAPPPNGPPIVGSGDDFFVVDALHHALHPPPPPPPPPVPFPDNVAVIMETDPAAVRNLVPVILHFAAVLGPKWPVVLLTRKDKWVEPPSPGFRRLMAERRLHIYFLPEGTTFPDHRSVSVFLTRPWFWEQFESAGRVLVFQADSVVCANSGRKIDDFVEWDLIGAPVAARYGVGYNGGLSLRNPKLVLEVVRDPANDFARDSADEAAAAAVVVEEAPKKEESPKKEEPPKKEEDNKTRPGNGGGANNPATNKRQEGGKDAAAAPKQAPAQKPQWMKFEDQWLYMKLKEKGAKLPDQEVAKTFSVETIYYEKPLGYHQPFRWLNDAQKKQAMEWCPEIGMLQDGSHFFS